MTIDRAELRTAIADEVEDCWDVDCKSCQMSAPTPCPAHLDLDQIIGKATDAALSYFSTQIGDNSG